MLKVAIVILTLTFFANSVYSSEPTNFEKFEANKKSPATAALLQFFFPGTGNAYAGQGIVKIIIYPTLYVGGITAAIVGGNIGTTKDQRAQWFGFGLGIASAVDIIGTIDAIVGCETFNKKLREKYNLVLHPTSADIVFTF